MKKLLISICLYGICGPLMAQAYPEPEFTKEIYCLQKDSTFTLIRLDKDVAKMASKLKMGGFGGVENAYEIAESSASVKLMGGSRHSFVFSTGATVQQNVAGQDSLLLQAGVDANFSNSMDDMMDPSQTIALYKTTVAKNKRKIVLQKTGGAFSGGKTSASTKCSFSVKKIRQGYWELVMDKPLARGEYVFMQNGIASMNASMDGSVTVFAFSIP